jgi:signal peptidase II
MALVLGGAVGNLIDRAVLGYVVDFVSVHWQQNYFPAFNIADSAITLGAIALGIDWIILEPRDSKTNP